MNTAEKYYEILMEFFGYNFHDRNCISLEDEENSAVDAMSHPFIVSKTQGKQKSKGWQAVH